MGEQLWETEKLVAYIVLFWLGRRCVGNSFSPNMLRDTGVSPFDTYPNCWSQCRCSLRPLSTLGRSFPLSAPVSPFSLFPLSHKVSACVLFGAKPYPLGGSLELDKETLRAGHALGFCSRGGDAVSPGTAAFNEPESSFPR